MIRLVVGLMLAIPMFCAGNVATAADNGNEVRNGISAQYEKVYWGPNLSVAEVAKAIETQGASIAGWCGRAANWLTQVGVQVQAKAITEMLFEGKGIPDVSGGIAAIQHWHMEKFPYIEWHGIHSTVKQRDVKIPEPNSFQIWIGYRKKAPKGGEIKRIAVSNGHTPNLFLDAFQSDTYKDGCVVQLWKKADGANQRWYTEDAGAGFVRILCADSGLCLDAHRPTVDMNGCVVQLWQVIPENYNQQWKLEDAGNGFKRVVNRMSGLVLDAKLPDIANNGCRVQLWHKIPENKNQLWKFE